MRFLKILRKKNVPTHDHPKIYMFDVHVIIHRIYLRLRIRNRAAKREREGQKGIKIIENRQQEQNHHKYQMYVCICCT